jgi:hypothetical protein
MHLMIDIETLSTEQNAIILNIGAIGFDPFSDNIYTQHTFYSRIDIESQSTRHESEETLNWWSKQHKDAQDEAFGEDNRIPLNIALGELSKLVRKSSKVWSQGVGFDIPILEDAYKDYGYSHPWKFWDILDCRTIIKMNPTKKLRNSHHALEDCVNQIDILQDTIKRLKITKIG